MALSEGWPIIAMPLGEDAIELVSEDPEPEVARTRLEESAALGAEAPVEAYLDGPSEQPTLDDTPSDPADPADPDDTDDTEDTGDTADSADEPAPDDPRRSEPPSRKPVKKTRGRASVPSWDEIMFGGPNE